MRRISMFSMTVVMSLSAASVALAGDCNWGNKHAQSAMDTVAQSTVDPATLDADTTIVVAAGEACAGLAGDALTTCVAAQSAPTN